MKTGSIFFLLKSGKSEMVLGTMNIKLITPNIEIQKRI